MKTTSRTVQPKCKKFSWKLEKSYSQFPPQTNKKAGSKQASLHTNVRINDMSFFGGVIDTNKLSAKYSQERRPNLQDAIDRLNNTPRHMHYNSMLQDPSVKVTIAFGPAGVGKTLMPSTHAIHHLLQKDIKKIVITRPHVNMGDDLGFLPGGKNEKMQPWLIPIYDSFKEYISADRLKEYLRNEEIEICPFNFMRGRTFHDSWIIADEVQNTTVVQMKALMTRIGNNSKMCLTGDLQQCDLQVQNGLNDFLNKLTMYSSQQKDGQTSLIQVIQFTEEDVMRSEVVKEILEIYTM